MAGKLMRAVQYKGFGGGADALKLVEVPIPSAKKDEILLKLEAASLNPVDWKIQQSKLWLLLPFKSFIPAVDITGEVVEVGPGVNTFKKGDKVVSVLTLASGGGLAEYAVASSSRSVIRPPEVQPAEGASLPVAALTAVQALKIGGAKFDTTGSEPAANVLITAASGGVGHFAVQRAKLANLHVTATCGARNIDLVKSLGADEVLDYKTPEGASLKSPSGRKYDSVIHCATEIGWSTFEPNLSRNGIVIDITTSLKGLISSFVHTVTFSNKKLVKLLVSPTVEEMKFVVELVKAGKVKPVIDSRHPLEKAKEAWAKSMSGHATGKIIVDM